LPEDLVLARASCDVVVAEQLMAVRLDLVAVIEERDVVLGVPAVSVEYAVHDRARRRARVGLPVAGGEAVDAVELQQLRGRHAGRVGKYRRVRDARHVVDLRAGEHAEARIDRVGPEADVGVVAGDRVVARAAVETIVAVERTGDVAAADQDVVAVAAVQDVTALLAHQQVAAVLAVDRVVAGAGVRVDVQRGPFEEALRREKIPADRAQAGLGVERMVVAALDLALVAEHEVVARAP